MKLCLLHGQGLATLRMLRQLQDRTGRQMHEVRRFVIIGFATFCLKFSDASIQKNVECRVHVHNTA